MSCDRLIRFRSETPPLQGGAGSAGRGCKSGVSASNKISGRDTSVYGIPALTGRGYIENNRLKRLFHKAEGSSVWHSAVSRKPK